MSEPVLIVPDDAPLPDGAVRTAPDEAAILVAFASGARRVAVAQENPAVRRAAAFARTVAEPLENGAFETVRATGGLVATRRATRERGSVLFVRNPTDATVTGDVFPSAPDLNLAPGAVIARVHDFPIGPSATYLGAYAGLVKCEPALQACEIRPDPHEGVVVFVHGAPGSSGEVVLFFEGRGEGLGVLFTDAPQVLALGHCRIVALPTALAGDRWELDADDALSVWRTVRVHVPDATGARLDPLPLAVTVDGVPADPRDLTLPAGESVLALRWPAPGPDRTPLLIPDGACYLLELTDQPLQ